MPEFTIPEFNTDLTRAVQDLANVARDATYVAIGAGVIGFQKAQVRRQALIKRLGDPTIDLEGRLQGVRSDLTGAVHTVDATVEDLILKVEAAFAPLEDRLPAPARDLARQAHAQAREARTQVRSRVLAVAG